MDKSVVKLWKECARRYNYWPLAICRVSLGCTFLGRLHVGRVQVKSKTPFPVLYPLWTVALSIFDLHPKTVGGPVDKVSAYGSSPYAQWLTGD